MPLFILLMLLMPFGPRLGWYSADLKVAARTLAPALGVAAVAAVTALALASPRVATGIGAIAVAGWLIGGSAIDAYRRKGARAAAFAAAIAHAGLGVSAAGHCFHHGLAKPGAAVVVDRARSSRSVPIRCALTASPNVDLAPTISGGRATIDLMDGAAVKAVMHPEQRIYSADGQDVSVTAIRTTGLRDLKLVLGDDRGAGTL